ncbi:MAG: rhodanese-like domain-containing protein [Dehalococcoidia bacterium]|nr:rhodanese-like domain-containing protein [Dehalococcoidia bacterium]
MLRLWLALRTAGETRLAELGQIKKEFQAEEHLLLREELPKLMKRGKVLLLDVRPPIEYQSGHLPGAVSIPSYELENRPDELPKDREIITYCRGEFCLSADESTALLRKHGFKAMRLEGGWPEWAVEGRPTEAGRQK